MAYWPDRFLCPDYGWLSVYGYNNYLSLLWDVQNPARLWCQYLYTHSCLICNSKNYTFLLFSICRVSSRYLCFTHVSHRPSSLIQASYHFSLNIIRMIRTSEGVCVCVCVGFLYTVEISITLFSSIKSPEMIAYHTFLNIYGKWYRSYSVQMI